MSGLDESGCMRGGAQGVWLAVLGVGLLAEPVQAGAGERDGCVVRLVAEHANGPAEVTADCRWAVAPERVIRVVREQGRIDQVLSLLSESTVLPDGRVVQVHSPGWMFADRQVTLRFEPRLLADGGYRLDFRAAREQERLGKGRVSIARDEGFWQVRPDGDGGTHLRYAVLYDAGGSLKPWLVRSFQKSGVARSMAEIRRAAQLAPPSPVSTER